MEHTFILYQHHNGSCPYLSGREWMTHSFYAETVEPLLYESLISRGFRRSGQFFYQNHCPGCNACFPIRVDVRRFRPTTSQRRVLRKNRHITMSRRPISFEPEDFQLYKKYMLRRHPSPEKPTEEGYVHFLIDSAVPTHIMRYYVEEDLVGLGWIDLLPRSLSSVYFAFDPDFSAQSLGTYSILRQIALARELQKRWLQLGFWVEMCHKMNYKSRFKPSQILVDGTWQDV